MKKKPAWPADTPTQTAFWNYYQDLKKRLLAASKLQGVPSRKFSEYIAWGRVFNAVDSLFPEEITEDADFEIIELKELPAPDLAVIND